MKMTNGYKGGLGWPDCWTQVKGVYSNCLSANFFNWLGHLITTQLNGLKDQKH